MSATTTQRALTLEFSPNPIPNGIPWTATANTTGLKGTIGVIDLATGYLKMGVTGTGLICVGRIDTDWDTTTAGNPAANQIAVRQGVFSYYMGTGPDAITNLNVGQVCYIIDNQTVGLTDGGGTRSIAGIVQFLAPTPTDTAYQQVYVQMGSYIAGFAAGAAPGGALLVSGVQSNTGLKTFSDGTFAQNNSGGTFSTTLHSAATVARSFTLPDIANATGAALEGTQTWVGVKTWATTSDPVFAKEGDHTVQVVDTTTAATAGGALTIKAAKSGTSGTGGAINLTAGAGDTSGAGGIASVAGGAGGSASGAGGRANLSGGAGTAGIGGIAAVTGGAASAATFAGGAVAIAGGAGNTTGAGGAISATGGAGGNDAVGGAASIVGGAAGGGNRAGGAVAQTGGAGAGSAAGGAVTMVGGAGGLTGAGGAASVAGGAGGATSGTGGALAIAGGACTNGGGNGGAVSIDGGAKNGGGTDGAITIGATAGLVTLGKSGSVVTSAGPLLMAASQIVGFGAPQALSGAGAANVTTFATLITSTGVGDAITLADGTQAGQIKFLTMVVDGGSSVITPATKTNFTTLTLTAAYDWGAVMWSGTAWRPLAFGGTAAFA